MEPSKQTLAPLCCQVNPTEDLCYHCELPLCLFCSDAYVVDGGFDHHAECFLRCGGHILPAQPHSTRLGAYKGKWVCWICRVGMKSGGSCPKHHELRYIGVGARPPKKNNKKAWIKLRQWVEEHGPYPGK